MTSKKNLFILRIVNALLFIVLIFIQYNSAFTIKIAHANPLLPMALLVMVCMFCFEMTAAISGLMIGIFMDCVASTPPGFNALSLLVTGLAVALIVRHLFNNNIFSAMTLCACCTVVYFLLRWVLCFAFSASLTENLTYLMQTVFPSVLYTTVFSIPFYYLEKTLYSKFYK